MRKLELPDSGASVDNGRRIAPSAQRNLAPICAVLDRVLPASGRALELASGTGQHIAAFAARYPQITWQPSDGNPQTLASIAAWSEVAACDNLLEARLLDACAPGWSRDFHGFDVICLTNLLHLIDETEAATLLAETGKALAPGGVFCLYGPFRRGGQLVSDGDKHFDASLKAQDPAIGYKDDRWVAGHMNASGLSIQETVEMPANNLMFVVTRPT